MLCCVFVGKSRCLQGAVTPDPFPADMCLRFLELERGDSLRLTAEDAHHRLSEMIAEQNVCATLWVGYTI